VQIDEYENPVWGAPQCAQQNMMIVNEIVNELI
jgi:hypothetical protein